MESVSNGDNHPHTFYIDGFPLPQLRLHFTAVTKESSFSLLCISLDAADGTIGYNASMKLKLIHDIMAPPSVAKFALCI